MEPFVSRRYTDWVETGGCWCWGCQFEIDSPSGAGGWWCAVMALGCRNALLQNLLYVNNKWKQRHCNTFCCYTRKNPLFWKPTKRNAWNLTYWTAWSSPKCLLYCRCHIGEGVNQIFAELITFYSLTDKYVENELLTTKRKIQNILDNKQFENCLKGNKYEQILIRAAWRHVNTLMKTNLLKKDRMDKNSSVSSPWGKEVDPYTLYTGWIAIFF